MSVDFLVNSSLTKKSHIRNNYWLLTWIKCLIMSHRIKHSDWFVRKWIVWKMSRQTKWTKKKKNAESIHWNRFKSERWNWLFLNSHEMSVYNFNKYPHHISAPNFIKLELDGFDYLIMKYAENSFEIQLNPILRTSLLSLSLFYSHSTPLRFCVSVFLWFLLYFHHPFWASFCIQENRI